MPRLTEPGEPNEIDELRERINRIDRADDIATWRKELQSLAHRIHGAARAAERNNLYHDLQKLIGRMR